MSIRKYFAEKRFTDFGDLSVIANKSIPLDGPAHYNATNQTSQTERRKVFGRFFYIIFWPDNTMMMHMIGKMI